MSNRNRNNEQARGLEALRQRLAAHPLMRPDRLPSIGKELAFAVADVRQKFEEAVYGRPVTPDTIHGRPLDAPDAPPGPSGAADHLCDRCRLIHDSYEKFRPWNVGYDRDFRDPDYNAPGYDPPDF